MKHIQSLNEWYKYPKNASIFNMPEYTYIDKVFDNLLYIIMQEKGISEKSFKLVDDNKDYLEKFFDNNKEILIKIDRFSNENKRSEYCAEYLYSQYFQNSEPIN